METEATAAPTVTAAPESAQVNPTPAPEGLPVPIPAPSPAPTAADLATLAQERAEARQEAARYKAELEAARAVPKAAARRSPAEVFAALKSEGYSLEELSKAGLNLDPVEAARVAARSEVEGLRAEWTASQQRVALQSRLGEINGALAQGDTYEQARAAGYTPDLVWQRQEAEFRRTGQVPEVKATLDQIEAEELGKLEKIVATSKAKAKLAPKPAPTPAPAPAKVPNTVSGAQKGTPNNVTRRMTEKEKDAALLLKHGSLFRK